MFQQICPECGRAIDRQVGECSVCDESEPDIAPLLPLPHIQVRIPAFTTTSSEGPCIPQPITILPQPGTLESPEPRLALPADYSAWALAQMQPADFKKPTNAEVSPIQTVPPSPIIPRDLSSLKTSLESPEIASAVLALPTQPPLARPSSWVLSLAIGAGIVAVTLGAAFYAMPSFARTGSADARPVNNPPNPQPSAVPVPAPPITPEKSENPLLSALEVTGIRFITDVPNQHPQVHYLVVNHSSNPIRDVTLTVTLHPQNGSTPLSQFSFRVPRLEAYESKEMVNAIEQLNRPVVAPDWRHTRVEFTLAK